MGTSFGKPLNERYSTTFDDAVDEMSIEKKVALYKGLQKQASLLTELENQLNTSIKQMTNEEAALREREDFLECRRKAYLKKLDPSFIDEEEEEEDEEDENEENDPSLAASETYQALPQDEKEEGATTALIVEKEGAESETKDGLPLSSSKLGSIQVTDTPKDQKWEEMRKFLEKDLPEIQRTVALRARTLWWKRREYDEKLEDTRTKLKEVEECIVSLEPGIPSISISSV